MSEPTTNDSGQDSAEADIESRPVAKILIVDDVPPTRKLFAMRLEREGFEVIVAENGAQAVELTISELPDLVLMDMGLPVKDGWTATQEIRAHFATREIPIIAFTNYDGEEQVRRCFQVGCNSVQPKAISFQKLCKLIEDTLREEKQ